MSNQRLLAMAFIVLTGAFAYVLERVTDFILTKAGMANADLFGGIHTSWAVALVIAGGVALFCWSRPQIQEAGQDVAAELRKVTWPTWPEIRSATIAVMVFSLVASSLLGVMDFISAKVMAEWIPAGFRWAQGLFA